MKLEKYDFVERIIERIIHNYIYILIIMSILVILVGEVGENTGGQMLFINDLLKEIPVVEVEANQLVEEINQLVGIENQIKQPNNSRHVYIVIIGCIIGALIWLKG